MDEFLTTKVLLSLPGCVTFVIFGTQVLKKFFSLDSKKIALIISGILVIARIFLLGEFDVPSILIEILNILPILWSSTAGYDSLIKNKTKKSCTSVTQNINTVNNVETIQNATLTTNLPEDTINQSFEEDNNIDIPSG